MRVRVTSGPHVRVVLHTTSAVEGLNYVGDDQLKMADANVLELKKLDSSSEIAIIRKAPSLSIIDVSIGRLNRSRLQPCSCMLAY